MGFSDTPSNYPFLKELREGKKEPVLKSCKYLKESTKLRGYQVVGCLHLICLSRMILGDSAGLGKCVSEDTLIPTSKGIFPIKHFYKSDIRIPDTLHALDGVEVLGEGGYKKASHIYFSGSSKGLEVITESGYRIKGLPHHPVLEKSGIYRKLQDLTVGDQVQIKTGGYVFPTEIQEVPLEINGDIVLRIDEKFAYSLGIYKYFFLNNNNSEYSDSFYTYLFIYLNKVYKNAKISMDVIKKSLNFKIHTDIQGYIVPDQIFRSPKQVIIAYVKGVIGVPKPGGGSIVFETRYKPYLQSLQMLLRTLGVNSVVSSYKLEVRDTQTLYDLYEGRVLRDIQSTKLEKVVEIKNVRCDFFDFHVPDGHNFVGNGFINHNTLQNIASYSFCLQKDPELKLLIVCPKSAMDQWAEEFDKFTVGITTHVLQTVYGERKDGLGYGLVEDLIEKEIPFRRVHGYKARKAQYETVDANVLIVNYYAIQEDYTFLIENRYPKFTFIIDECQEIKNHRTLKHMGADEIANRAHRVYGLSATVIKNRLEEAYYIYKVIVPGLLGGKNKFLAKYTIRKKHELRKKGSKKKIRFNEVVGYKDLKEFKRVIDPFFLIRKTRDVAKDLPSLISKKVVVEMTTAQRKLYKEALSGDLYRRLLRTRYFELKEKLASQKNPKESDLVKYEKLQIAYDNSLTEEGVANSKIAALSYCQLVSNGPSWVNEEGVSAKEDEFRRLFEYELSNEKVIVFTRFKSGIPILEKILDDLEMSHVKITGDVSSADRNKNKLRFQDFDDDVNVIFITYAGSAAINLQSANVILFYDTPWSYGDLYQTIGRAQRIGSIYKHIYLVHLVTKETIDEHVLKILEKKKSLINDVMGDIAHGAIEFGEDELLFEDSESDIDALYSKVFS